ncbi:hypothetical protein Nmel_005640 [Mimus melanotis]
MLLPFSLMTLSLAVVTAEIPAHSTFPHSTSVCSETRNVNAPPMIIPYCQPKTINTSHQNYYIKEQDDLSAIAGMKRLPEF